MSKAKLPPLERRVQVSPAGIEELWLCCVICRKWQPVTAHFFTQRKFDKTPQPLPRCRACEREKNKRCREKRRGHPALTVREVKERMNAVMWREAGAQQPTAATPEGR